MSASYTDTITDLKKLKKFKGILSFPVAKTNIRLYTYPYTQLISPDLYLLRVGSHARAYILKHSYCLNLVNLHDCTQKTLYRNCYILSDTLNLAITYALIPPTPLQHIHRHTLSHIYIRNPHPPTHSHLMY